MFSTSVLDPRAAAPSMPSVSDVTFGKGQWPIILVALRQSVTNEWCAGCVRVVFVQDTGGGAVMDALRSDLTSPCRSINITQLDCRHFFSSDRKRPETPSAARWHHCATFRWGWNPIRRVVIFSLISLTRENILCFSVCFCLRSASASGLVLSALLFCRLKNPRNRKMSAHVYALHSMPSTFLFTFFPVSCLSVCLFFNIPVSSSRFISITISLFRLCVCLSGFLFFYLHAWGQTDRQGDRTERHISDTER